MEDHTPKDEKPLPGKNLGYYVLMGLGIVFFSLFLVGIIPRIITWREIQKAADEKFVPKVYVSKLKPETNPIYLTLPSITEGFHATPIWARVNGYLQNFYVDIGDEVKEGDVLALIDTPELDKELLQAKADYLKAKAELDIAIISAERWNTLYKVNPEAVPKQEVDERMATLSSSKANLESLAANVERLEKTVAFKRILAPFDGIITTRNIDIGSLITAGSNNNPQQLFQIADMNIIRTFSYVPQSFYRLIKIGMPVNVEVQEIPHKIFQGIVARTSTGLDPVARTLKTQVNIDNKDLLLTTGLYATIHFALIPDGNFFIIPTNSMLVINDGPKVPIVKDNHIEFVNVTIGRDFGKTIEITSGLKEGDVLVLNPDATILPGVEVEIVKDNALR